MTWQEALLTLQIEAEERMGRPQREALLYARAREDAAAASMDEVVENRPRGPR